MAGTKASRQQEEDERSGLRDTLTRPLELVLLSVERIQESVDEAVVRGRMTREDANDLVAELVTRGRRTSRDLLGDVEQLLGRGREQIETAAGDARRKAGDRAVRAGRVVGLQPAFPIDDYDDLTVAQVRQRLPGLTPAELRKLRDHERRNANRKSVLAAVDKALD